MIRTLVIGACVMLVAAAPTTTPPVDPALALLKSPTRCTRAGHPDEIVVCGYGLNREAERQRLPLGTPPNDGDPRQFSVSRERNALVERQSGDGMLSCASAVGPSGEYGCLSRDMKRAHEQHPGGLVPTPHPLRTEEDTDTPSE